MSAILIRQGGAGHASLGLVVRVAIILFFGAGSQNVAIAQASTGNEGIDTLTPFWSVPLSSNDGSSDERGLLIVDIANSSTRPPIALAKNDGHTSLLLDINESGPGQIVPLSLNADGLRIAADDGDTVWIGGFKNRRNVIGAYVSEAYLAKLDRKGKVAWERSYGGSTERTISSLSVLPLGELIVAGRDNNQTWLAKISKEGNVIWEHRFGLGKGAAVIAAPENRIILSTFDVSDAKQKSGEYSEDVVLWIFDISGKLLTKSNIREGINSLRSASFGRLVLLSDKTGFYLFSAWTGRLAARPVEAVKLNEQGLVIWRRELPDTIIQRSKNSYIYCAAGATLLQGGDGVVACSILGRLSFYKLQSETGALSQALFSLPSCHDGLAPALFPFERSSKTLGVIGSRPENLMGPSCSWFGEVPLGRFQ